MSRQMPEIMHSISCKCLLNVRNFTEIKRGSSQVVECDTRVYKSKIFSGRSGHWAKLEYSLWRKRLFAVFVDPLRPDQVIIISFSIPVTLH
jgi:hypothetical protein